MKTTEAEKGAVEIVAAQARIAGPDSEASRILEALNTDLSIPAFLRREPGAPRTAPATERVWLKGVAPKPPFKKQVKALVALGWSKSQAGSVTRAEAAMAIRLQSPATARFMTDLWRDGGDGKPK